MPLRSAVSCLLLPLALAACAGPTPTEFWRTYTENAVTAGYLRAERDPLDAPVDAARLTASFETIGFSFESDPFGTGAEMDGPPMIRKWREPIAYRLVAEDPDLVRLRAILGPFAADLAALTGHEIGEAPAETQAEGPANVVVLFGSDDFLNAVRAYDQLLASGVLEAQPDRADAIAFLARVLEPWQDAASPCAGQVFLGDGSGDTLAGEILFAVIMIRAELPERLLRACVEEEFAQLMGLFDDDESLRPSIFNDDQEFALLTGLDRQLLRILYDRRLAVGMGPEEAMPIVGRIAHELAPEG